MELLPDACILILVTAVSVTLYLLAERIIDGSFRRKRKTQQEAILDGLLQTLQEANQREMGHYGRRPAESSHSANGVHPV